MTVKNFDSFMSGLKQLVDSYGPAFLAHGPMRVYLNKHIDGKRKLRHSVVVESGWDHNYGGRVQIDASPTGKSITVYVSKEVKVERT